jgi:phosphoribosylformylglycinamidine synthase
VTLWEVDVHPADGVEDRAASRLAAEAADLGIAEDLQVKTARGFLLEGELTKEQVATVAEELLVDGVVEQTVLAEAGDAALSACRTNGAANGQSQLIHVLPKPGVTDPVAESTRQTLLERDLPVSAIRTLRKYWVDDLNEEQVGRLCSKLLANDSIEQVVVGPLEMTRLEPGTDYQFEKKIVPLGAMDDAALETLSREGQLYLSLTEMQTIQAHFRELNRDPVDVELETVAQTWSEHCSHKTLAGRIAYQDENGERNFENMLKETIFAATMTIREQLGDDDWCVGVFEDNAGIVRFDDETNIVFKVETHNHPSALEPYGGANTGIGGVIRDPLGTGLGAKPVCNTDVFCFAPIDTRPEDVPAGALHPRRVMKGVVSGVRDYGNRMGIPTVNGAIYFDDRYLGNPLVYCGNVGILPRDKSFKKPLPGDLIVAMGGRTGRDGIHGATFSSAELTSESEELSGGAVQIGNAITEKMVQDVLLAARDRNLYSAVTDCGAGGFSSAVGEMGEKIGAEVHLDRVPLKYSGLSYTEIWISEAQERMVLAVPAEKWDELKELADSENVEVTVLGEYKPTGRLRLLYEGEEVADLSMEFLHDGRPPVVRRAEYQPPAVQPIAADKLQTANDNWGETLQQILAAPNVASKEWVIRQYDHEVQGGSVIKPLVGVANDGPSDAAVVRPRLESQRGVVISCGMNPRYGDFDTYHMATSAIDEAVRNCVAVGADPSQIAILDNFCWGNTERPETLGTLVRAAIACQDLAVAWQTPFISGKDSLNNEFRFTNEDGTDEVLRIPSSLLISAMGQVADVARCVTMDFKQAGNVIYLVGQTYEELGGSHFGLVRDADGGHVPQVRVEDAKQTFEALHRAIQAGTVRACHDLSEGGLAVAVAEMAFAGGLGGSIRLADVPCDDSLSDAVRLFSESNSRFCCEVPADQVAEFEKALQGVAVAAIGSVTAKGQVHVEGRDGQQVLSESIEVLKESWQAPLRLS